MTLTAGNDVAISRVRSVEWSSTTMISKETPVWVTSDSRQVGEAGFFVARGDDDGDCGCASGSLSSMNSAAVRSESSLRDLELRSSALKRCPPGTDRLDVLRRAELSPFPKFLGHPRHANTNLLL